MEAIEPKEVTFDAYTMCSFLPALDSSRAIPLVLIGYRSGEDPWFVWLVPKDGISAQGLTDDPYYAKVLRDPHAYFVKKLNKYIEETGSCKRGIEMLIDCMSRCMQQDGDLKLASLSAHSATVLELTRTDRLFDIYESSTEAVLGFSSFVPGIASMPQTIAA